MRWLNRLRMKVLTLFRHGRACVRLDDEIRDHLERQIAENISAGMSPEEARYSALRSCAIRHTPHGAGAGSNPCSAICVSVFARCGVRPALHPWRFS